MGRPELSTEAPSAASRAKRTAGPRSADRAEGAGEEARAGAREGAGGKGAEEAEEAEEEAEEAAEESGERRALVASATVAPRDPSGGKTGAARLGGASSEA